MKTTYFLLSIFLILLYSCNKDTPNTTSPNTTLPGRYTNYYSRISGLPCWNNIDWCCNPNTEIWVYNGVYYIDSLNYVFKNPLSFTPATPTTLIIDPTYYDSGHGGVYPMYIIVGGNGQLIDDTLAITINGIWWNGLDSCHFTNTNYYAKN